MASVPYRCKCGVPRAVRALLVALLLVMVTLTASALEAKNARAVPPGGIVWSAQYADPLGGDDCANCVAVAPDGSVRTAAAWGESAVGNPSGLMVRRHTAGGLEEWSQAWISGGGGADRPISAAVDRSGNFFVAGDTGTQSGQDDIFLLKYSPGGGLEWAAKYDGPGGGADTATAVLVDGDGNAYLAGTSEGAGTSSDFVLLKYAPDGAVRWEYRYAGPISDGCFGMAMDPARNVFLTGASSTSVSQGDCVCVKVASNGKPGWAKRFKAPGGRWSMGLSVATGKRGEIVVVGQVVGSAADQRWLTLRYAGSSGGLTWSRMADSKGTGADFASAVKVSSAGEIYVAGTAPSGGAASYDMVLRSYSPSGTQRWAKRYGGGPGTGTGVVDMARDSSGDLYILAYGAPTGAPDCFVVARYRPDGSRPWASTWKGAGPDDDEPRGIAATRAGAVYVVGGASTTSGDRDEVIMRFQR